MDFNKFKSIIDGQLKKGLYLTAKFHELLFDHELSKSADYKIHTATLCLSEAFSCINSANMLYLSNCEDGECQEFESLVHKFNVFNDEFINSYSTNHSLQWTNLTYNEFLDSCKTYSKELSEIIFNIEKHSNN